MPVSHEVEIRRFQSVTGWQNEDYIINYLKIFNWDLDFAVVTYLDNFDEINENREIFEQQILAEQLTSQEDEEQISDSSSEVLVNTYNQQQNTDQQLTTTDNSLIPTDTGIDPFDENIQRLIENIDSNVIGRDLFIITPWGQRKVIYADYTASGRALKFIEKYMTETIRPLYGKNICFRMYSVPFSYANTHSEHSACALQTTRFREASRALIKEYVHATDDDVVIFTGSGSTAAINKLVGVLGLKNEEIRSRTVVFISTLEHHSNILPWKETGVHVVRIPNDAKGLLDYNTLKEELEYYRGSDKNNIICTFNAASNVTGILTDVDRISTLVHEYDGLIFWDYAAGAPYLKIDMNPSETAYKDAVFISTHKFVGGPSTPGILVAKKKLFMNVIPSGVGGGTVNFVTREQTEYLNDIESREEGGTSDILGSIQAGLVFRLKDSVGEEFIEKRENRLVKKFFRRFRSHPTLKSLGSPDLPRLAIFSFLIYVPIFEKYLHHNFICVLLNDLFGIQVRSGCSCAGPYVLELLGINDETAAVFTKFITENENNTEDSIPRNALMKPGFSRFNLSYFASDEEVDYILDAIEFVANDGWRFLSLYTYNPIKAIWHPRNQPIPNSSIHFHSLHRIIFEDGIIREDQSTELNTVLENNIQLDTSSSNDPLEQAKSMKDNLSRYIYDSVHFPVDPPLNIPVEYQDYIWFITPIQVIRRLTRDYEDTIPQRPPPFCPN
ncbi:unnamed protein product [Adineta steineri]|uniref:Aminotransferase class V domain-containing protein n=1 Tax=Adineta steineri TaxID=433720 RepID=A0A814XX16_9BILA|nr:unnamed protein product [Adineta steineri]CAF1538230.1 unnamed protein product [Adineta steineri]